MRSERLERYFGVQTDLLGLFGTTGVECWHIWAGTDRYCGGNRARFWQSRAVRTFFVVKCERVCGKSGRYRQIRLWKADRSRRQIRAVRTDLSVKVGLIFEQIRGVRTEFAVIIEQFVANQGGMDRFCGANWQLFSANQGGRDRFCTQKGGGSKGGARSLADPRKTAPKTTQK